MPRLTLRLLRQNVVYWEPDAVDVNGNTTYKAGVELKGRWEEKVETVLTADGENAISRAVVYTDGVQTIVQDGRMFKGLKADLSAAQIPDPNKVPNAYRILLAGNSPDVRNRRSLNKVWLK